MYVRFLEEKNLFKMNSGVKTLIPILYRIFFEFWREFYSTTVYFILI
ncbi:hypothetical protein bcere0016_4610 [Bacillus cereus 95/8201]|nr:hypothetical protein BAA_0631 [Bacillus anthracis str. A0248]AEW53710.1 hypothetical protein bcf_02820 [Bacillus cereus F837/76]EEL18775.1 hypothetical protein bcere0016_4610 [Bacillus cereus 95/8201]EEM91431.1 hypothetical protein bthur0012_4780 [Bacillus thuringiensis serovar pulsiensis BGSC 4CC1]